MYRKVLLLGLLIALFELVFAATFAVADQVYLVTVEDAGFRMFLLTSDAVNHDQEFEFCGRTETHTWTGGTVLTTTFTLPSDCDGFRLLNHPTTWRDLSNQVSPIEGNPQWLGWDRGPIRVFLPFMTKSP